MNSKALILLSGGLDSATCLYSAKKASFELYTISFRYGQRHSIELEKSAELAKQAKVKSHFEFTIPLSQIGGSALTTESAIPKGGKDIGKENIIPVTYVPARNLIFLSLATAYAEVNAIRNLFIGANAVDYSGYPDCRPDFLQSFIETANLSTKAGRENKGLILHTPLLKLSKSEIVSLGSSLGVPFEHTWSCYDPVLDPSGKAQPCRQCDSCLLREKGFSEANIQDTLLR